MTRLHSTQLTTPVIQRNAQIQSEWLVKKKEQNPPIFVYIQTYGYISPGSH